jgi:hypothetical protein
MTAEKPWFIRYLEERQSIPDAEVAKSAKLKEFFRKAGNDGEIGYMPARKQIKNLNYRAEREYFQMEGDTRETPVPSPKRLVRDKRHDGRGRIG